MAAPGYTGPAFDVTGYGFSIRNVNITGTFETGILVNGTPGPNGSGKPSIHNAFISVSGIGIDWSGVTDGFITEVEIAHTLGHNNGVWVDQPHGISTTTPDAGLILRTGGAMTLQNVHVWGDFVHGIAIFTAQNTVKNCRLENYGATQMLIAGWWNMIESGHFFNTSSYSVVPAVQIGILNEPGTLGYIASMPNVDMSGKYCRIEVRAENTSSTQYPNYLVICDHEDWNVIDARSLNPAWIPTVFSSQHVGYGANTVKSTNGQPQL